MADHRAAERRSVVRALPLFRQIAIFPMTMTHKSTVEPFAPWRESFVRSLDEHRERVRRLLDEHRDRFADLERQLLERAHAGVEELSRRVPDVDLAVERQQHLLDEVLRHVRHLEEEFTQRSVERAAEEQVEPPLARREAERLRDELLERERALLERETELAHREEVTTLRERETEQQRKHLARQFWSRKAELLSEVERARAELSSQSAGQDMQTQLRLTEEMARSQQLQTELRHAEQQHLETRQLISDLRSDLESERLLLREYAELRRQWDDERTRLAAEVERERTAVAAADERASRLTAELKQYQEEAERRVSELRADNTRVHDDETSALFRQLDALTQERDAAATKAREAEQLLQEAEARWDEERETFVVERIAWQQTQAEAAEAGPPVAISGSNEELFILREECAELRKQLEQAQAKVGAVADGSSSTEFTDLQRRLELAHEDLRELKARNQDLAAQLSRGASAAATAANTGGGSDWESMKKRLLAQMESDFDATKEQDRKDKLSVQGAIAITDQIVADRDREVQELRRLLEQQSDNIGNVAVGAAAIAQFLDQDELIVQQRESLKIQEHELRDKLRQAEVEISMERAKLARERMEIEEKLRTLEAQQKRLGMAEPTTDEKPKLGARGQWLSRLGLRDGKTP